MNENQFVLCKATENDSNLVASVGARIIDETYGTSNSPSDLGEQ